MRVKLTVTGIVQGVGFRPFIYRTAVKLGLTGYVFNRGDAGVEVLLEGDEKVIERFMFALRSKKPPLAQIYDVVSKTLDGSNEFTDFTIIKSSKAAEFSGSVIPPDTAICDDCLRELRDPRDPRFEYFFITCVNCGPRFTIINHLPYDRINTTMDEFPLCGLCLKEYQDPTSRRFHAQTVACPACGPKAYLTDKKGEKIQSSDPVRKAGKLISEGNILAIKGYGGFHLASSTTIEKPLKILRKSKHRISKPFAVMVSNLKAAKSFVEVNPKEEELLTSPARPIVLLNKKASYSLSDLVAPGLHNVGIMLPYSAMHYMLFDGVDDLAFVMTSANPANQPIVNQNVEALNILGETVDYFLFHDRKIAHRCDDSVTRVHGESNSFIRRSRGYAPAPIVLKDSTPRCVLALGGELNNTCTVLNRNKAFISQHIGDVENLETKMFLQEAIDHLIHLTNTKIDTIACDLHPKFTTTNMAKELAENRGWNLVQVQHHYAHIAALMMEHGIDEMMGIACDGYGYGSDGGAWGGEILLCDRETADFQRLGHLEAQPLLGGDLSTRYPLRIAAGILHKNMDVESWLLENSDHLPHGKMEADLIAAQLKKNTGIPLSTSLGRILDASAAILGLCYQRTYEGEAAMKLESVAMSGKDVLELPVKICGDIVETSGLLFWLFENRYKFSKVDLAYSVHAYLARGLASLAVEKAVSSGVDVVGLSGGAAVNSLLPVLMRRVVESAGLRFVVHEAVPAGDGGVSFGQAVVGGFFGF